MSSKGQAKEPGEDRGETERKRSYRNSKITVWSLLIL